MHKGWEATATLWPDRQRGFGWVHEAAEILKSQAHEAGEAVRSRYQVHLKRIHEQAESAGTWHGAVEHFLKVTRSYWPGLFQCDDVEGLPRTNNDLEQFFGTMRHQERRTTGRKRASSARVVRGAVRVIAASATSAYPLMPEYLAPRDPQAWRAQRRQLQHHQHARVLQRRFRQRPDAYLSDLEARLVKLNLPP